MEGRANTSPALGESGLHFDSIDSIPLIDVDDYEDFNDFGDDEPENINDKEIHNPEQKTIDYVLPSSVEIINENSIMSNCNHTGGAGSNTDNNAYDLEVPHDAKYVKIIFKTMNSIVGVLNCHFKDKDLVRGTNGNV